MKILLLNQVFHPDTPATAQHAVDLARYLVGRGHEVTVVASRRAYDNRNKLFSKFEVLDGIKIIRVWSTGLGRGSFLRRVIDAFTFDLSLLIKLLVVPHHDVTIAFTSPPLIGFLGMVFIWIKGGKLVQWQMDINPEAAIAVGYLKKSALTTRILLSLFRMTLRNSFRVIVLDRWMKKTIQNHGIPAENISVVPPWPMHELEKPTAGYLSETKSFLNEHGLEGKFIVLYSGNHSIVHPLDTLLHAARVLSHRSDIVFLFIGGGLRTQDVRATKEKHQLKNIVQLPYQPRERVAYSLNSADLHVVVMGDKVNGFVHASKIYGILATGRPFLAIGSKESYLEDIIQEGAQGFRVAHGDIESLVQVIEKAKDLKQAELERIIDLNYAFIQKRFTNEKLLAHFYEEVIEPLDSHRSITVSKARAAG